MPASCRADSSRERRDAGTFDMARPKTLTPEQAKQRQRVNLKRYQARNREKLRLKMAARRAADPERHKRMAHENYLANKERRKQQRAKRHAINPKTRKDSHAKWSALNPQQMRGYWAKYAKKNPLKMRQKGQLRRAMVLGATIGNPKTITKWEAAWRSKRRVTCYWCSGTFSPKTCHSDHIHPLAKGGSHAIGNLCISCQPCNSKKHARELGAWNATLNQPVLL
jgi:5-methylcytosine-specific restriction endonuclease McrA